MYAGLFHFKFIRSLNFVKIERGETESKTSVWGKKLSGVEWSGVESWSGVCIVAIHNTCIYRKFLRYTKNMVTLGLNREIYHSSQ